VAVLFIRDRRRQPHASCEGREKATELALRRNASDAPGPAVLEGTVISARQWRAMDRRRGVIWLWVGLAAVTQVVRNLHPDPQAILRIIVLTALIRMGQKKLTRALTRLIEQDKALKEADHVAT